MIFDDLVAYATIGSFVVALIKYGSHYYMTRTLSDDWMGHIFIAIAIVFLVASIVLRIQ